MSQGVFEQSLQRQHRDLVVNLNACIGAIVRVSYFKQKRQIVLSFCAVIQHGLTCGLLGCLGHLAKTILFKARFQVTWHIFKSLIELWTYSSEFHGERLIAL